VQWVTWFNHDRLHEALGDIPPTEFEHTHALQSPIPGNRSVTATLPKAADRPTTRRLDLATVQTVAEPPVASEIPTLHAQAAPQAGQG
jgi:hypothetical protein